MRPPSPEPALATAADLTACRALLRDGSRTFHAASFLLPRRVREPACALYAFCRVADDAVDCAGDPASGLAQMRERLLCVYARRPWANPADRAFAAIVADRGIPRALPEALLEGFAWDVEQRRYDDLAALEAYAARVAGTVGAMMALLMGVRDCDTLARACELGIAMQLSNIARDVGEDARAGRLYLPLQWLREAGIDPDAWLAAPVHSAALGGVVARLLGAADERYARAARGVLDLPAACRPGISAARLLYAEIGHEVRRRGCDGVTRRATVAGTRKARVLARSLLAASRVPSGDASPPCAAARFLVAAAGHGPGCEMRTHAGQSARIAWWNLSARLVRSLDLFERLERREMIERASSRG